MSIELPPELAWVARLAVGQQWPDADEDGLLELGAAWNDAAQQLVSLSSSIDPATSGVLHSIGGRVADQFEQFTTQLKSTLPGMAEAAGQLGELGRNTGVQVEYSKYMILAQLVWLAAELIQLAFWAPEAVPAAITSARLIIQMILRRLLTSVVMGVGFMVGMDAAIQTIQLLKGDRTKWDTSLTLSAVESGAISGGIGGLLHGVGGAFVPKFTGSLIGKAAIGGATGVISTAAMDGIFGGESDWGATVSSSIIGAMGGGGGRRRFGGGDDENEHIDTDFKLPPVPDLKIDLTSDLKLPPPEEEFPGAGAGEGEGKGFGGDDDAKGGISGLGHSGGHDEVEAPPAYTNRPAPTVSEPTEPTGFTGFTEPVEPVAHQATEGSGGSRGVQQPAVFQPHSVVTEHAPATDVTSEHAAPSPVESVAPTVRPQVTVGATTDENQHVTGAGSGSGGGHESTADEQASPVVTTTTTKAATTTSAPATSTPGTRGGGQSAQGVSPRAPRPVTSTVPTAPSTPGAARTSDGPGATRTADDPHGSSTVAPAPVRPSTTSTTGTTTESGGGEQVQPHGVQQPAPVQRTESNGAQPSSSHPATQTATHSAPTPATTTHVAPPPTSAAHSASANHPAASTATHPAEQPPPAVPPGNPGGRLDQTPRYVVRSGFDLRRFETGGQRYADLTVRVALRDPSGSLDADDTWARTRQGVQAYFNAPGHRLPSGEQLHVTVERVAPDQQPHLTVDLVGSGGDMDQHTWAVSAEPAAYAHEIAHQLGLRDEYRDVTGPQRPHVPGSLLGDFRQPAEDAPTGQPGLRGRHLALLGALVGGGDDTPAPPTHPAAPAALHSGGVPPRAPKSEGEGATEEATGSTTPPQLPPPAHPSTSQTDTDPAWQQARDAATVDQRAHTWVDPVSDPTRTLPRTVTEGESSRTPAPAELPPPPPALRQPTAPPEDVPEAKPTPTPTDESQHVPPLTHEPAQSSSTDITHGPVDDATENVTAVKPAPVPAVEVRQGPPPVREQSESTSTGVTHVPVDEGSTVKPPADPPEDVTAVKPAPVPAVEVRQGPPPVREQSESTSTDTNHQQVDDGSTVKSPADPPEDPTVTRAAPAPVDEIEQAPPSLSRPAESTSTSSTHTPVDDGTVRRATDPPEGVTLPKPAVLKPAVPKPAVPKPTTEGEQPPRRPAVRAVLPPRSLFDAHEFTSIDDMLAQDHTPPTGPFGRAPVGAFFNRSRNDDPQPPQTHSSGIEIPEDDERPAPLPSTDAARLLGGVQPPPRGRTAASTTTVVEHHEMTSTPDPTPSVEETRASGSGSGSGNGRPVTVRPRPSWNDWFNRTKQRARTKEDDPTGTRFTPPADPPNPRTRPPERQQPQQDRRQPAPPPPHQPPPPPPHQPPHQPPPLPPRRHVPDPQWDGHDLYDPAFAGATPPGDDVRRQAPARMTDDHQLGASDLLVSLRGPDQQVVHEIRNAVGNALGDHDAGRTIAEAFFGGGALKPRLSALSRGDSWEAPFKAGGWSGTLKMRVEVTDSLYLSDAAKLEFEGGSEQQTVFGRIKESRHRWLANVNAKFTWKKANFTPQVGYLHDRLNLGQRNDGGRTIARGKTVEPASFFGTRFRLSLDFDDVTRLGQHIDMADRHPQVDVVATVAVPHDETAAHDGTAQAPPATRFRPPQRVQDTRRLGGSDIVLDVSATRHDPTSGVITSKGIDSVLDDIAAQGRAAYGNDLWNNTVRPELATQLALGGMHQDLKGMMSGDPLRIEIPAGFFSRTKAVIEVGADVHSMDHLRNTPATEFNVGTGVVRSGYKQHTVGHLGQLPLTLNVTKALPGMFGFTGSHQRGRERIGVEGSSQDVTLTTKLKGPGAVFQGQSNLRFNFRRFEGSTEDLTANRQAASRVDFTTLIEHKEAVAANGGPTAFTAVGPRAAKQYVSHPANTDVARPRDTVFRPDPTRPNDGHGLPDTVTTRDVDVTGLHAMLDRVGHRDFGDVWNDVRDEVLDTFSHTLVASHLTSMTRGLSLETPQLKEALLRHGIQVSATARVEEMSYKREDTGAELNPVAETGNSQANRTLFSRTSAGGGVAGGEATMHRPPAEQHPADQATGTNGTNGANGSDSSGGEHPEATPDQVDIQGSYSAQHRSRIGWRSGSAGKVYANGKYKQPQALFDAKVAVDVRFTRVGSPPGPVESHTVDAEFSMDSRDTLQHQTTVQGPATFRAPAPAAPAPAHQANPAAPAPAPSHQGAPGHQGAPPAPPAPPVRIPPPPPFKARTAPATVLNPPPRIAARGAMGASDVLHSLGPQDTHLLNSIEQGLRNGLDVTQLPDDLHQRLRQGLDPFALKGQLSRITRGGKITVEVDTGGWKGTVTVRGDLANMRHTESVGSFEFELGSQQRAATGIVRDSRVRHIFGLPVKFKLPHTTLQGAYNRLYDFSNSMTTDGSGSTVSRGKTVEAAALFTGDVRLHVTFDLHNGGRTFAHGLPGGGAGGGAGARGATVTLHDAVVAVPERDGVAPTGPHAAPAIAVPDRISGSHRLGSSDIVTDVHPVPEHPRDVAARAARQAARTGNPPPAPAAAPPAPPAPARGRQGVEETVDRISDQGRRVLGSDWDGMRRKIVDFIGDDGLVPTLKPSMSGGDIVLRHGRSEVRISSSVSELKVTGVTGAAGGPGTTEFNTGTSGQRTFAEHDDHGGSGSPGNTITGTILGTSNPFPDGAAVVAGGGATRSWGDDKHETAIGSASTGMTTKSKQDALSTEGRARLVFTMTRRPLFGGDDKGRIVPEPTGAAGLQRLRNQAHAAEQQRQRDLAAAPPPVRPRPAPVVDHFAGPGREALSYSSGPTRTGLGDGFVRQVRSVVHGDRSSTIRSIRRAFAPTRGQASVEVGFTATVPRAEAHDLRTHEPDTFHAQPDPQQQTALDNFRAHERAQQQPPGGNPLAPAPAPVPVRVPPPRVWTDGLRDVDVTRWVGDSSGISDIIRARGPRFFGGNTWNRMNEVARQSLGHTGLSAGLGPATRGDDISTPVAGHRLFVNKARVSASVELLHLEYQHTDTTAELSPAGEVGGTQRSTHLTWTNTGGQLSIGAEATADSAEAQVLVNGGYQYRQRGGTLTEQGGRVLASGKFPTRMARYTGYAKVTVTFTDGKRQAQEHGVIPVTVDIPENETTLGSRAADATHQFSGTTPGGADLPRRTAPVVNGGGGTNGGGTNGGGTNGGRTNGGTNGVRTDGNRPQTVVTNDSRTNDGRTNTPGTTGTRTDGSRRTGDLTQRRRPAPPTENAAASGSQSRLDEPFPELDDDPSTFSYRGVQYRPPPLAPTHHPSVLPQDGSGKGKGKGRAVEYPYPPFDDATFDRAGGTFHIPQFLDSIDEDHEYLPFLAPHTNDAFHLPPPPQLPIVKEQEHLAPAPAHTPPASQEAPTPPPLRPAPTVHAPPPGTQQTLPTRAQTPPPDVREAPKAPAPVEEAPTVQVPPPGVQHVPTHAPVVDVAREGSEAPAPAPVESAPTVQVPPPGVQHVPTHMPVVDVARVGSEAPAPAPVESAPTVQVPPPGVQHVPTHTPAVDVAREGSEAPAPAPVESAPTVQVPLPGVQQVIAHTPALEAEDEHTVPDPDTLRVAPTVRSEDAATHLPPPPLPPEVEQPPVKAPASESATPPPATPTETTTAAPADIKAESPGESSTAIPPQRQHQSVQEERPAPAPSAPPPPPPPPPLPPAQHAVPAPTAAPTHNPPAPEPGSSFTLDTAFPEGAHALTVPQRAQVTETATRIVDLGLAWHGAGSPPPRTTVASRAVVRRDGMTHFGRSLQLGDRRSRALVTALRQEIAAQLAQRQQPEGLPPLTPQDFPVEIVAPDDPTATAHPEGTVIRVQPPAPQPPAPQPS